MLATCDRVEGKFPSSRDRNRARACFGATRSARGAVVVVAAVLGIADCGYEDAAREQSMRRTDGLPTIAQPECDDTAQCRAGFSVGGKDYSHSCGAVGPDLVTGEALARGRYGEVTVEMRAVRGVEPGLLAAISIAGGNCDEGSA